MMRAKLPILLVVLFAFGAVSHAQLTADDVMPAKPMISPAAGQPGLDTWMFGQAYGNTVGAYNFGDRWYRAGQGLHFGIDLSMPCGTPLVAVADGTVQFVDDRGFGSLPHNVIIRHDALNVTTLYGHLLETPTLVQGQFVQQGDVIARSGDPDLTCSGRPHLHFEVRSLDYSRTVNPVDLIDANWHSLAMIGPYGFPLFQQNLANPRQWVTLEDQPDVYFWGQILNSFPNAYPPGGFVAPPPSPTLERTAPPIAEAPEYTLTRLKSDGCCANAQWHPTNPDMLYVMDGAPGTMASVFAFALDGSEQQQLRQAPIPYLSADGTYELSLRSDGMAGVRGVDGSAEYSLNTSGRIPTLNLSNTRLLWTVSDTAVVPGQARPNTNVYVSGLDGTDAQVVFTEPGASARWIDDTRILVSARNQQRETSLSIYDLFTKQVTFLGTWREMRGLNISPGGRFIAFYISWQTDPATNGIYLIDTTQPNIPPQHMPWFGAWRWRDASTLYYVPFEPDAVHHTLRLYDTQTAEDTLLIDPATTPFTIADGYWEVSADGTRILFQDAADNRNLSLLEPMP